MHLVGCAIGYPSKSLTHNSNVYSGVQNTASSGYSSHSVHQTASDYSIHNIDNQIGVGSAYQPTSYTSGASYGNQGNGKHIIKYNDL